jgi:hypothetical protein
MQVLGNFCADLLFRNIDPVHNPIALEKQIQAMLEGSRNCTLSVTEPKDLVYGEANEAPDFHRGSVFGNGNILLRWLCGCPWPLENRRQQLNGANIPLW